MLRPGAGSQVHSALAPLAGLELKVEEDCVRVACLPSQKIAVLNILAALADTVHDIAIHEPSLEDLFLGYGGLHVRQG
jgi:Cu-processing system ATP-binding protein